MAMKRKVTNLTDLEHHFEFGKNWMDYAKSVGDLEISEARRGLIRLLGTTDLSGKRFLDIGCGSGIHMTHRRRWRR